MLAYYIFDREYAPAQRQRYSDLARYGRSKSLTRHLRIRGMEIVEVESRKATAYGEIRGFHGIVFNRGLVECEITTSVTGSPDVVERRLKSTRPLFSTIMKTMEIKGHTGGKQ